MSLSALPPVELADGAGSIRLHRRDVTLVNPVVASHGEHRTRRVVLIEVTCTDGTTGWGECGAPDDAGYTGETADGAAAFLDTHLVAAIGSRRDVSAGMVSTLFTTIDPDAEARHPMALRAVEMALLDAQLRANDTAFESMFGAQPHRVALAGATLGNTGDASLIEVTLADAERAVGEGYGRLKIKIGRAHV